MTDEQIIDDVLLREGGYVDHPADHGGPTNFGVTLSTLGAWRGKPVTADDVRSLTEGEARDIYREMYVHRPGFNRIADDRLRSLVIDAAVNHGAKRAVKLLQAALKITVDGTLGPETIKALFATEAKSLYLGLCAERVRFYGRILSADHSQVVFASGWMNRMADFIEAA